jgi:hypothetical protein
MISIIIPTLWNSDNILKIIDSFMSYDLKGSSEIIIIDNSNSNYVSPDETYVKVYKMDNNIFVNPAWNLGVELSKNNHICLLNDDIFIDIHTLLDNFKSLVFDPNLEYGMIAVNPERFKFFKSANNPTDKFTLKRITQRGNGFGMMMILQKQNYEIIPEDFKIYFGDDILWYINKDIFKRNNYCFVGLKITGEFSVTSKHFEQEYLQEEFKHWNKIIEKINKKYGTS